MTPLHFHEVLMMLSTRFAFSETSGKRSLTRNAAVDGHPDSRHLLWLARDVVLDDPAETAAFVKEAQRQGLVVIAEEDHLHVQVP